MSLPSVSWWESEIGKLRTENKQKINYPDKIIIDVIVIHFIRLFKSYDKTGQQFRNNFRSSPPSSALLPAFARLSVVDVFSSE